MTFFDPMLFNDWLPVANCTEVSNGELKAIRLLGQNLVLWRSNDGDAHAWQDRCPHRGSRLSLGHVREDRLVCPYHGWNYDVEGKCVHMPSHPTLQPPKAACVRSYKVQEKYGVIWVCMGEPAHDLDVFPEYDRPGARHVNLVPYEVNTSGPRLMENFLDMAHFPFVHTDILGQEPHTEVKDYTVKTTADGLEAINCFFWQPAAMPSVGHGGADIEYVYRVKRPLIATLSKVPQASEGPDASALHLMLVISPVEECKIKAWLVTVFENDTVSSDQRLYDFNLEIFLQDVPIVESQEPKWLPLEMKSEVHQRCDQMAVTYRRWLKEHGLKYGTSLGATASEEMMLSA